jgi:hypothetical protein
MHVYSVKRQRSRHAVRECEKVSHRERVRGVAVRQAAYRRNIWDWCVVSLQPRQVRVLLDRTLDRGRFLNPAWTIGERGENLRLNARPFKGSHHAADQSPKRLFSLRFEFQLDGHVHPRPRFFFRASVRRASISHRQVDSRKNVA